MSVDVSASTITPMMQRAIREAVEYLAATGEASFPPSGGSTMAALEARALVERVPGLDARWRFTAKGHLLADKVQL